jgi:hypothetical protein
MSARFLTQMGYECRSIAAQTETPHATRAMIQRARAYLDAAHDAAPETVPRRVVRAPSPDVRSLHDEA